MTNPVVVEVLRGDRVESSHRGAACVVDADGKTLFAFGDTETPIYPRSAVKAFQALPLIESGAADAFSLDEAEIALACASHSGQPEHVRGVERMLGKASASADRLCCGAHWPLGPDAARALSREGQEPTALHNNCSGKHAGFLCLAAHCGWTSEGYVSADHPVQREVRAALSEMTGEALDDSRMAIDGCSIPTYAISLQGLARGFAKFASGEGLSARRADAAARLRAAIAASPFEVAGDGRFDTLWMQRFGAKSITKTGAEGVFTAALPDAGLGLAVKADDGAGRAAEVMIAHLIARFAGFGEAERADAERFLEPELKNVRGIRVGSLRAAGALA